ncbi:WXG100 family type VII secretion target [Actinosynnema sp. NPDC023658]|uniref:WXG100 family type VII secretion target n=1 Tax=Actinosynnema sp. NPDC023658 TaxID=3155465 RepID=UPI0033C82952
MTSYTFDQRMADQARDQMAEISTRLRTKLAEMHEQVMSTLQEWDGPSRDQYQVAKSKWDAAANRMPHSLNAAEVALQNITGGYVRVEHTGVNAFGGFDIR